MNSILKKTLIAATVAGAFGANAATIVSDDSSSTTTGIQQVISAEGLALATSISTGVVAGNSTLRVGLTPAIDSYSQDDLLRFTFTGATITSSTTQAGTSLQYWDGSAWVTVAEALNVSATTGVVTFGLVDTDSTTTALDNILLTDADANTFYIDGVGLQDIDASTGVVVSYTGRRQLEDIDAAGATTIATVGSQYSLGSSTADYDLDATIDVEQSRRLFVDAGSSLDDFFNSVGAAGTTEETSPTTTDSFALTVSSSANLLVTTPSAVTHSLTTTSNFDWTLSSSNAYNGASATGTTSATSGITSIADSLSTDQSTLNVVVTGSSAGSSTTTVALTVPGTATLTESEFEAATTVAYYLGVTTTAGSMALGTTDVGEWGLSGATRFVEFYPTGTGITQFIYIANTSDVEAEVELTVYDDNGTVYECGILDTKAAPNAVTKFGPEVFSTVTGDCGVPGNRLALSFTINAPDAAIDLTAGYNSRGDRVLID